MNNVTSYFKKKTDFLLSATQPRQYPNVVFPEVAFIGRSNVGKSSLINAVFMKKLAHISVQLKIISIPINVRKLCFESVIRKF